MGDEIIDLTIEDGSVWSPAPEDTAYERLKSYWSWVRRQLKVFARELEAKGKEALKELEEEEAAAIKALKRKACPEISSMCAGTSNVKQPRFGA